MQIEGYKMVALYSSAFFFGVILIYFLIYRKNSHGLHSINVYTYCYALYTLSIPISYSIFGSSFSYIEQFLLVQNIGLFGLLLSVILGKLLFPVRHYYSFLFSLKNDYFFYITFVLLFALYLIYLQIYKGGLINYLTVGYQYGEDISTAEKLLGVFSIHPLSALISVYFICYFGKSRTKTILCLAIAFMLTVLLSVGGHRNLALWLLSPLLVFACYKGLKLKITYSVIFTLVIYSVGMLVGIFRHYGFGDLEGFKNALSNGFEMFDPRSQELVTSYNVMTYWFDGSAAHFDLYPFESYILGLVNLLPKFIFPVNDTSIADRFSAEYAVPGEGLGFSINLEALLNLGFVGPFIIAFVLGSGLLWLNKKAYGFNFKLIPFCIYLNLPAVALNLNRIDFATVTKLLMIKVLFMAFIFFIFVRTKPNKIFQSKE